ncbi:Pirin [Hondaea fermentalgiana]|uniref:Pirin n=1 Tax=Hondaea fermentalgiana TaxID=2315210 RepID=A0A2R5GH07_9STRA|nr:Pirin [Hondaea fermentalgiana]|eukprot:GBG29038.1 Pirin [Hondaea fermentalgiana]
MEAIRKVDQSMLFVSEPNPFMFGNRNNDSSNPTWTNKNWLKSRFHFSFAEYHNRRNSHFGKMRVMNDDLVQPKRGFGAHPHANMEIVTYVVRGKLSHSDDQGNAESLGRHCTQFMSAGRGVVHSEFNASEDEPVRFIQMWFNPRKMNMPTRYGSTQGDPGALQNQWQHLVSDDDSSFRTPVKIGQDINLYVTVLDENKEVDFHLRDDRQAYLLCIEGTVTVSGIDADEELTTAELTQHDASELFGDLHISVRAEAPGSHVLLVEMKKDGSSRFA